MSTKKPAIFEVHTGSYRFLFRPQVSQGKYTQGPRQLARVSVEQTEVVDGILEAEVLVLRLSALKARQLGRWLVEQYAPWAETLIGQPPEVGPAPC